MELARDRDGSLWAAAENGLSRIQNGRVATLTTANGLPCNAVHWIIQDDQSSYWLYTRCGLLRIARTELDAWAADPKRTVRATTFDAADGIRPVAALKGFRPAVTKSSDGKIWFLNGDTVSVIDPSRIGINTLPPPVHIEQIAADGKTYDGTHGLRLPPRVRNLVIDYTALSLVAPEKVRFRFKLEGQDPDWREVVNDREVQYSNLAPGNYRFRVTASNNSGVWNEAGDVADFSIDPAYYQTNWFRALLAAMLWCTAVGRVPIPCAATSAGVEAASGRDRNDSGNGLDRSSGRVQRVRKQALGRIYRFVRGGNGRFRLDGCGSPRGSSAIS